MSLFAQHFADSQELHEAGNRLFVVPGARIPGWVDHCSRRDSVSVWIRNKFPTICVCAVVQAVHNMDEFVLTPAHALVSINGKQVYHGFVRNVFRPNHIIVNVIRRSDLPHHEVDLVLREGEWNHVKICIYTGFMRAAEESGIYVIKQDCSMDDIRFTPPYPSLDHNLIQDSC